MDFVPPDNGVIRPLPSTCLCGGACSVHARVSGGGGSQSQRAWQGLRRRGGEGCGTRR